MNTPRVIITWSSPDRVGLLSEITSKIARHHSNLLEVVQHTDSEADWFFLRIEADTASLCPREKEALLEDLKKLSLQRDGEIHWVDSNYRPKVALFVSKAGHCLADLLWRWEDGELAMDPCLIIANHPDLENIAKRSGIDFVVHQIKKENKDKDFSKVLGTLQKSKAETVVLARYMQILPQFICSQYSNQIINIHHSFLPSFAGADPYGQALNRGVKLIGATCHYATAELDAGPIIEQEVRRVRHDHTRNDLIRLGQDCERLALAKGLRLHLQKRVFVHQGKTIILGD